MSSIMTNKEAIAIIKRNIETLINNIGISENTEAYSLAITALEKQEAVEPIETDKYIRAELKTIFYCSVCGSEFGKPTNYCGNCGQRLKEDETNG